MKHSVLKPFIDKETLNGYSKGSTFESDDSKRVAFLAEQGYINAPKKETEKPKGRKAKDGD